MIKYIKSINEKFSFAFLMRIVTIVVFATLLVDIYNIPSLVIVKNEFVVNIILASILAMFFISLLIETKVLTIFAMKSINYSDALLVIGILSCGLYLLGIRIIGLDSSYKKILLSVEMVIFVLLMLVRVINYIKVSKIDRNFNSNIIDLKDVYEGNFQVSVENTIMLDEKDVDYDLLQRTNVIDRLYHSIILSKPKGKFVISLEGSWGSGKTTIINNVKRKLNEAKDKNIIIDEFDPWSYQDQESLFQNMFDIIIKRSGYSYSTQKINRTVKQFSKIIFGGGKELIFYRNFTEESNILYLKSNINDYLRHENKKVIFFIDNIDRLESKNVLLLFNIVANILDFEHVTYVLSFDNARVKDIFDSQSGLDYRYLKKVIQMQIKVPEFDRNVLRNLYLTCIKNITESMSEDEIDLSSYELIIDHLCINSLDIRDFKRFINSVISIPISRGSYLCKRDLFFVEYIKIHNLALYNEIQKNRRFFITYDKHYDYNLFSDAFSKDKFSQKAKEYYDGIFAINEHNEYKEILKMMFPYIKRYMDGSIIDHDSYNKVEYKEVAKKHRICSAKYFDLYFTQSSNDFLAIGKLTSEFVNSIRDVSYSEIQLKFKGALELLHPSYHKEFFERLQDYIDDIDKGVLCDLAKILYSEIHNIDHSAAFMALDAQRRTEVIISQLLLKMKDDEFESFIAIVKNDYKNIEFVSSLISWIDSDDDHNEEVRNIRNEKLKVVLNETIEEILMKKTNIYLDEYYVKSNIWSIYRNQKENPESVKNFIKEILNESNVYRFIFDIIGLTHGTNYTYSINQENLDLLSCIDDIQEVLQNVEPKNSDEEFVEKVFEKFLLEGSNGWDRGGITLNKERQFIEL